MLTIIWANAQPGTISRLERMTPETWESKKKEIPSSAEIRIDCDGDTILILSPDFPALELRDWKEDTKLQYENGLIPIVTIDKSGTILMQAFSTPETVGLSLKESMGIYFSRSRNGIWRKGDTSGHTQKLHRLLVPENGSFLVYEVDQTGAACHEGYYSCFFRGINSNGEYAQLNVPFLGK